MKIAIIGCGNMGMAFANSFIQYNLVSKEDLLLIEKNKERGAVLQEQKAGVVVDTISEKISAVDLVILSVKPQDYASVANELSALLQANQIVLSIMAGIPISKLQESLKHDLIVRAMPNTPALVGKGVTGIAKGEFATDAQLTITKNLLEAVGQVVVVNEDQIDVVAAASGSGPAYYFYVTELLIEAAVSHGLSRDVAQVLVENTFIGSSALFENSDDNVVELRRKVTSPKGTTQAAIEFLESKDLKSIWQNALGAAINRAEEISKN